MHNQNYNELYISLTQEMAGSEIRMNRLTAFFLIENSIDAESIELHPKLKEILLELRLDKDLFAHYYERIQKCSVNIFTYPSYWYPSETGIFLCLSLPAGAHAESRKVFFI